MKDNPSVNDEAISALCWLLKAETTSHDINDYGDATGIRASIEQLRKDVSAAFNSIERRAWDIVNQAEALKESERKGSK